MPPDVPSLATAPRLTSARAEQVAREIFGVSASAIELPSERDQNFRLTTDSGSRYVLKIANAAERRSMLDAENACMQHLASTGLTPTLVPARDGEAIALHGEHLVRLITWIDGRPLGDAPRRSDALLTDLGRAVGLVDRALASFDHPAVHRDFHWDLAHAPAVVERHLGRVTDPTLQRALTDILAVYRDTVAPRLPSLRQSAIHGDANDYNVLVDARTNRVTGLVDFGDMVFSHTVNDLAIAMAYASLGQPDPLAAAGHVAAGYHAVHPLTDDELAALFGLMAMRLCLSVSVAAAQQAEAPDREYLGISQAPIRDTLPTLAAIHPRLAHYRLRDACGLSPVPHSARVVEWLRAHGDRIAPLTGFDLRDTRALGLDFSAGSPLVASNPADNTAEPFTRRVFAAMREAGTDIGVGGYDEARLIYASDAFSSGAVTDERRTVHIGIDVTMAAGSPLYAPLDGVVHGFEDARARLDYGPVIVLRHEIPPSGVDDEPLSFFTLYGHLDRASLEGLTMGQRIQAGERFAAIGAPPDNGDWWPHVHVQIITDLLDVPCNFNGVAPASQRRTWLSLSPDPNLLLRLPAGRFARHLSTSTQLTMRREHVGANVRLSYGEAPLQIVRGWMQYLFDENGRTYIDAYNNVPHVGHAHPRVTAAVTAQLATLNTNTRYLHETVVTYAAELAACFPAPLQVCFFTASGSEANELALRLARAYTGRRDLVVMDAAYHGHTTTLIDISPYKHAGPGGAGAPAWVHRSPIPDVYRGAYRADDPAAGLKYAREVGAVIDAIGDPGLCAYLAETCPSVAGQIVMPPGFLPEVYRLVRAAGGVCIADEVQTGFGRIGTHLWAFEAHDVVPDIVVLGKPIANGYPMGAVVTTRAIADRFDNGMEFFSTFGGSTAACAAARATLRATFDDGLQAHALDVGDRLLARLRELQRAHDLIGDVRGSGLFIGVELVSNRDTRTPATEQAAAVVARMRELGVLVGTDGPFHNVIKIRGPMPLSRNDAECIVAALERALTER
jgi:4-aminobutyrate aminotransferase-like enzyme/Ser/Thr protein kinase RdoA (MazF antagonist)/murein DD-endopeptidase MepM/ murein hydrolase activator NlpD